MVINKHWEGYRLTQILVAILESKGTGGKPGMALPFSLPKKEAKALGDSPSASSHVHIWRWRNVQKVTLSHILVKRQPWYGSMSILAWDRGESLLGLSLSLFALTDMAVNKHWEEYMLSQILVAILESKGPGGNPGLALPFSLPKIEEKALGDSPSASSRVHIWRWRNVQKVILSQILVKRQPWHGSMNRPSWNRGKSLTELSLSQFTCTHMAVKKCSEGYFVSNFGQGSTSNITCQMRNV